MATKREYSRWHGTLMEMAASRAGLNRAGCAAFTAARALCEDPDNYAEAAEWLPVVVDQMRSIWRRTGSMGLMPNGATSRTEQVFARLGIEWTRKIVPEHEWTERAYAWERYHEEQLEDFEAMTYQFALFPTVAQFLRDNPGVQRAILFTRGHVAFLDRKRVYGASARHRVLKALVLEEA